MNLRHPDKERDGVKLWHTRTDEMGLSREEREIHIDSWLLEGPFHPVWNYWVLSAISLVEADGFPPSNKQYPEAEYEIMIVTLDPEHEPDPESKENHLLTPPDLVYQLDGISRDEVREILGLMVEAILQGKASPDVDYRQWWVSSLDATVQHYKEGKH